MDPTLLHTLTAVGGMIIGFLIRHFLGSPTSSGPAAAGNSAAVVPTPTGAVSGNAAVHPLLGALTAQFDAAIQQVAANFANATLAVPTTAAGTPPTPSK